MPCGDINEYLRSDIDQLEIAVQRATRAACDMRTIIRRHGLEREVCDETRIWIEAHDAEDARRIAEEQADGRRKRMRRQALKKLNLDERRVLGL